MASGLGKPILIRDQDCDVEPLDEDDFEEEDSSEMRLFVIHQAKLGVFCMFQASTLFNRETAILT